MTVILFRPKLFIAIDITGILIIYASSERMQLK